MHVLTDTHNKNNKQKLMVEDLAMRRRENLFFKEHIKMRNVG